MSEYLADFASPSQRSWVRLEDVVGAGASGTIHRVAGRPELVAKLYKDPAELPIYRDKIAAMLAAAPKLPIIGGKYVQIAWPVATLKDKREAFKGFLMPVIDFQESTELENILQRKMRQRKGLPEDYRLRVRLAANLAAVMGELHAAGHYMIDMKPVNLRFYRSVQYMAIIDADGFSIGGARRHPARQYSDEYIAPEAQGKSPQSLGVEQDLFALATIVFRLLDNGLHPFQGISEAQAGHPTALQDRIFAGLYAYGRNGVAGLKPAPQSIHGFFEDKTLELFERAFFSSVTARPSALEWAGHLKHLVTGGVLVGCAANPDHAHFSKGCGLCALESKTTQLHPASIRPAPPPPPPPPPPAPPPSPPAAAPATSGSPAPFIVLAIIGALAFYAYSGRNKPPPEEMPAGVGPNTPAPAASGSAPPTVAPPLQIALNRSSANVIAATGAVTFRWSAPGDARCQFTPPDGFRLDESGPDHQTGKIASPGAARATLVCERGGQTARQEAAIEVLPPPLIEAFGVWPSTVTAGKGVATIVWRSLDTLRCRLSSPDSFRSSGRLDPKKSSVGTVTGSFDAAGQMSFALTCIGLDRKTEVAASAAVTVLPDATAPAPAPAPEAREAPPACAPGDEFSIAEEMEARDVRSGRNYLLPEKKFVKATSPQGLDSSLCRVKTYDGRMFDIPLDKLGRL